MASKNGTATMTPSTNSEGPTDKSSALELALGQIEKRFGQGAIMRLGEGSALQIESIPTGSIALDIALGIGARAAGGDRG